MEFIGREITVTLPDGFSLEKKPPAPDSFKWRGKSHRVTEMLANWHRYGKPEIRTQGGRPPYSVRSGSTQGSWGQGRAYFRVRTEEGRLFDIYYDRAPKGQRRAGAWFLWRELSAAEEHVGLDEGH